MKTIQYTGPFSTSDTINVPSVSDRKYVHIGIQVPYRQPIRYVNKIEDYDPIIEINGTQYTLNENNILEFDGMAEMSYDISFLANLPEESIIDIVYKNDKR